MPGSAATCPSTKLKIVVSLPDVIAKQTDHGPAQVPRTASAAQAFRHSAALGNPVIASDRFQNHGMIPVVEGELSEMRQDLFGEHFHVVDLAVEVAGFGAEPEP